MARPAFAAALLLGAGSFLLLAARYTVGGFAQAVGVLGTVAGLVGLILLSRDPVTQDARQRRMLIATLVAALGTWFAAAPGPAAVEPRAALALHGFGLLCGLAFVALPLWLLSQRLPRGVFVGGGAAALAATVWSLLPVSSDQLLLALQLAGLAAYGGAAAGAWIVSYDLERGKGLRAARTARKPPRLVVASNIVQWTPEQKARRLAELERKFQAGEMAEHDYWDKRQEIESK